MATQERIEFRMMIYVIELG
uniref:Uncharacterized protein n=1 Tax=Arundo donax TaxID=35708 RepID=A0A0A9H0L5_ARUDO